MRCCRGGCGWEGNLMDDNRKFHIQITPEESKPHQKRFEWDFDLSAEELERRYIAPYRLGRAIVIDGRVVALDEIHRTHVYSTERDIGNLARIPWEGMKDVTDEFITGAPGWERETQGSPNHQPRPARDAREVFVVHGRNGFARDAMFEFLHSLDLHPLEWSEAVNATGKASPYIGEILDAAFSRAHAVVVLFTPDDEARLKEPFRTENDPPHETQLTGQARPNVLFEAGMAMARDQDRTVLVELGNLRPFSDVAGRHAIRLTNNSQQRQELAQRLGAAGCPVNLKGTRWHTAGDFEAAIALPTQDLSEPIAADESPSTNPEHLQLSEDAKELLNEAVKSSTREILKAAASGGLTIQAGRRSFTEKGNARSEARWEQALRGLLDHGLVEDPKGKDQVFKVTHTGFEVADGLGTLESIHS